MLNDGRVLYVPGVGQWDGKEWTYELPDGLGSVRQLADAQGYLVQRYDYAPFGEALSAEGKGTNSLRYTGARFKRTEQEKPALRDKAGFPFTAAPPW